VKGKKKARQWEKKEKTSGESRLSLGGEGSGIASTTFAIAQKPIRRRERDGRKKEKRRPRNTERKIGSKNNLQKGNDTGRSPT